MRLHLELLLPVVLLPLLSGCPAKGDDDDDDDGITVSGTIENAFGGFVSGAAVLVNGELVTSDASGNFTVDGVSVPYSLYVYDPGRDAVTGFVGATRPDPTIRIPFGDADNTGSIDVTLSPAGPGIGESSEVSLSGIHSYGISGGVDTFTLDAMWSGGTSVPSEIFAMRTLSTAGLVSTILDQGTADVTFQANQTLVSTVTMNAITQKSIDVAVTLPAGYEVLLAGAILKDTSSQEFLSFLGQTSTAPFTVASIDSALYATRVQALAVPTGGSFADGYGTAIDLVSAPGTAVTLAPAERTTLDAPAAGSAFGPGSTITWTSPLPSGGYTVDVFSSAIGTSFHVFVGATDTFTLPDLSAFGAAAEIEAGEYNVAVGGTSPSATVDEMLAGLESPVDEIDTLIGSLSETRTVTGTP